VVALLAFSLLLLLPAPVGSAFHPTMSFVALSATDDYVNISATSSLSFVPSTFTVYPGAHVHLIVTQEASFPHTFTLSSVANTTVSATSFFHSNPPLVNISLGSTVGGKFYRNFTAPAIGTYEFVCLDHFPTMKGTMTSSTSSSSGGGYAPLSATIPPLDLAIAGAVALIVIATAVTAVLRRRKMRAEETRSRGRK
jgi:plastocyanin